MKVSIIIAILITAFIFLLWPSWKPDNSLGGCSNDNPLANCAIVSETLDKPAGGLKYILRWEDTYNKSNSNKLFILNDGSYFHPVQAAVGAFMIGALSGASVYYLVKRKNHKNSRA